MSEGQNFLFLFFLSNSTWTDLHILYILFVRCGAKKRLINSLTYVNGLISALLWLLIGFHHLGRWRNWRTDIIVVFWTFSVSLSLCFCYVVHFIFDINGPVQHWPIYVRHSRIRYLREFWLFPWLIWPSLCSFSGHLDC